MSDEKILRLLKRSESEGFALLVRRYSAYVKTVVRSRLGAVDPVAVDETVNGAFFEILKALRQQEYSVRSLKALISVVTVRQASAALRERINGAAVIPIDEQRDEPMYDSAYDRAELIMALKSLGEPDCEIFLRKYFLGQKSAEIADALGMKQNTVDQRVSRGLKKLRDIMEG